MYWLNETWTYDETRQQARARIEHDRGRSRDHDFWVPLWERSLAEHITSTGEKGDPCVVCGGVWPCGAIHFILAPD